MCYESIHVLFFKQWLVFTDLDFNYKWNLVEEIVLF